MIDGACRRGGFFTERHHSLLCRSLALAMAVAIVRPSRADTLSKRRKLESRNPYGRRRERSAPSNLNFWHRT